MNRRNFLTLASAAAPIALVLPELLLPRRTFFLPPRGGWTQGVGFMSWAADGGYLFPPPTCDFGTIRGGYLVGEVTSELLMRAALYAKPVGKSWLEDALKRLDIS